MKILRAKLVTIKDHAHGRGLLFAKRAALRRTLMVTQSDVERLIDMPTAIRVVRQAFRAQARGQAVMPPKIYLPLPHESDFRAMPAYLSSPSCCGMKWVNVHPRNPARGLPTVMGTLIINDPASGFPLAIMDGLSVTRLRTAAAGGVAAKALARPDSRTVGLVGCGAQALSQIRALAELFRLREAKVWGYRTGEAGGFCAMAARHLAVTLVPVKTLEECVTGVDILVTITPSRRPLVKRAWLKAGAHINAIGADAPGKEELDPQILQEAKVVVDDREQASHGGELNVPLAKGWLTPRHIHATLGDILLGRATGRTSPDELTVFDSTGIAVHDIALGYEVFHRARRARRGRPVRFFSTP